MEDKVYIVEIYEGNKVYISTDGSSGCDYKNVRDSDDVGKCLSDYIDSFDLMNEW